jgi:tetratricopeptide (TPR) repeat protein
MKLRSLTLTVLLALAACSRQAPERCDDGSAAVVDTDVMAYLSKARALHHEANAHEGSGDVASAIGALERLVASPIPHPERPAPEIEEVLADTHARLAELRAQKGDLDGALRDVEAGLAHAPTPSYFRGHLLEVQGVLYEQRAAVLRDAGKTEEAEQAKARAVKLLQEAVQIQDEVIQRSLGDGGPR